MIFPSVLIAAFAFVNKPRPILQRWGHTPRAFVNRRELQVSSNKIRRHLLLHHNELLASSSESADSGEIEVSVSSKPKSGAVPEDKGTKASIEKTNATATKTARVTRITSKNKAVNIGNATSTQGRGGDVYDNDDSTPSIIQGLLPKKSFDLFCHIHCTLTLLRAHFPTLLELPALSSSTAKWIYDSNVTVTGPRGEERLAEGLDEVLLLNRALATAATAARRAGSLFDLAVGGSAPTSSSGVECELLIDPINPLKVMVLWQTRLPSIGILSAAPPFGNQANKEDPTSSSSASSYTEFSGKSTVDLSADTGRVTNLQINEVKVNGVAIVESLGTALAAVRRAARSAMATSSIFDDAGAGGTTSGSRSSSGNPLLDGLLNGIKDVVDAVDALPSSEEMDHSSNSPLYVVPGNLWAGVAFPVEVRGISLNATSESHDTNATTDADSESSEQHSIYAPVLVDQYSKSGRVPLVGSEAFVEYAISHEALQSFAKYGIHQLAGMPSSDSDRDIDASVSVESIRSFFTTDAELVTSGSTSASERKNYMTLLRGAGKLADLYRSLALFRETSSGGEWGVKNTEADLVNRRLVVSWVTESPLHIEGTDIFNFEAPSLTSSQRLPLSNDGDKEALATRCSSYFDDENDDNSIPLKINRIENVQLNIAGVAADSTWSQSFVSAALRSGIADNAPLPDTAIAELLRALTTKKSSAKKAKSPTKKETPTEFPLLEDAPAVTFYGIIRAIHNDFPNIATSRQENGQATGASSSSIPAGEFLSETVELRGLLGEVLVRGSQGYRRLLGVAISSLRAAIQTNTVRLAAKPRPTVEVTSKGSIKVNLVLALWVAPQLPLGGGMGQSKDSNGFGVPLKIEVLSEYVIDNKSARIREHRILESRLNGVLTPGDVFSRWIRGLAREEDDNSKSIPPTIDSLMDAIAWVRSMQERK
mmetsp:Transcript_16416/g.39282  ORF Transcript_16416/g.39282 Transcript_16416/m.39282 type:complete len:936 (-) Transcript_16416:50-2857(-)